MSMSQTNLEGTMSASPFNIDVAIQNLLGNDPLILELPNNINEITEVFLELRRHTVQLIAARLKRVPPGHVEEKLWKQLAAFLAAMYRLKVIDPNMKSQAQLDKGLEAIFNPIHNFPLEYAQVAEYIYKKLEAERWGADEVEADDLVEDEVTEAECSNNTTSPTTKEKKKPGQLKYSDFPADTDPIYGLNGIMHHILRIQGQTTAYQIDPSFKSKNAMIIGNNGLKVGDCWPNQIALLRDGGHGQRMGGISGNTVDGTYSIVVSGMYDDLDQDQGEFLFYSGSNSLENTAPEPVTSSKTKALERSIATGKPVRVFRSAQGKWRYAPRAGLRYDGLYTVVSMSVGREGINFQKRIISRGLRNSRFV